MFFYDRAKAERRPQPFAWPKVDSETMGQFREALLDYVGLIRARLKEIHKELEQRRAEEIDHRRLNQANGQRIYLHGRKEHSETWDRVYRELDDSKYNVFPDRPEEVGSEPKEFQKLQDERLDVMRTCDAVLVLGTQETKKLMADLNVIGDWDRRSAIARYAKQLPCGVVDTGGVVKQKPDSVAQQGENSTFGLVRCDRPVLDAANSDVAAAGGRPMTAQLAPAPEHDIFDVELPPQPYPGLRPFEKNEWPIFFGREVNTGEVVRRLIDKQFIAVHGDSGLWQEFAGACRRDALARA